ncbi:hypothetical protein [Halorussus sp. AFM4]|uniref:hypothetical protein n=1 Tax=Halorussus sp. AFM4 TaxID=3421651 RepID=UPI003EC02D13
MQAVSIDGTVIEADRIKLKKAGIELQKRKQKSKKKKSGGGQYKTTGFLPYDHLMYVIPDDVVHNVDDIEVDEFPVQSAEPETIPVDHGDSEGEVTVVLDEDMPAEDREQIKQELEEAEEQAHSE